MRYNHFDMLPEKAFQSIGKRMTYEGGGGGKGDVPSPPPPTTVKAEDVGQTTVAPATDETLTNSDKANINANRMGKSKLRIDLDPLVASSASSASTPASAGSGLAIAG